LAKFLFGFFFHKLLVNILEQVFKPSQTQSNFVWSIILLMIIDVPFFVLLFLSFQEFSFLFLTLIVVLFIVNLLVLSLGFLGNKMSFRIQENMFLINFGFSKREITYDTIRDVKRSETSLLLRLFGASWPGLHWGLFNAKDVGKIWVYSTMITGEFVVIELVDGNKIAVSPENPKKLYDALNNQRKKFGTSNTVNGIEQSKRLVYLQVVSVATAFLIFLGYLLWIYPTLPEIIPVHFDFNMTPNRWGHKSELFIISGIAAVFPIINSILILKFGKYAKTLTIFLGIIFISLMILFFGIVYFTQSIS
jgi:hypothetical protein